LKGCGGFWWLLGRAGPRYGDRCRSRSSRSSIELLKLLVAKEKEGHRLRDPIGIRYDP
jgi:hypothetical protein